MVGNSPIRVPKETLINIKGIMKMTGFKKQTDVFRFNTMIQPMIIGERTIKLPRSKHKVKCIDVRYTFKI